MKLSSRSKILDREGAGAASLAHKVEDFPLPGL